MRLLQRFFHRNLNIKVNDGVKIYSDLGIKHTSSDGKVLTLIKTGTELHRDTNTLQQRERRIDKANPYSKGSYTEKIVNPTLGITIEKNERLVDHKKPKKR